MEYLRLCFWYSAGVTGCPADNLSSQLVRDYVLDHYKDSIDNTISLYLKIINISFSATKSKSSLNGMTMTDLISSFMYSNLQVILALDAC